jgi:hypothetical protein
MSRWNDRTDWNVEVLRMTRQVFLAAGMIAAAGVAGAQTTVPDAQVEANVLKALATAPELANQSITTNTVYGTVTLSGTVSDEAARTRAENLAANAAGVKKVVDELRLGSGTPAPADNGQQVAQQGMPAGNAPNSGMVLMSDGTYAPAPAPNPADQTAGQAADGSPAPGSAPAETAQRNNPEADRALDEQAAQQQPGQNGATEPGMTQPGAAQPGAAPTPPNTAANGQTAPQPYGRRPMSPAYPGYPYPYGYPPSAQQPPAGYAQQQPIAGGQVAGQQVAIPAGALLRIRVNKTLSSNKTQPGTTFDGVVMNDVVANGLVAIPRGAVVSGKVIDAKSSGALTGRGEMSMQLTQVTLGGKTYPLSSDIWAHNGGDKTIETVNKTAGLGALGAILGAVAGGGAGAAIGGGVGAAAGLGSSAASGRGQVFIPAEAIVTFHTAGENQVATVSEQEMQRLSYAAGPGAPQPVARPYRAYPGYYPPPGYYPYPAYGYPSY